MLVLQWELKGIISSVCNSFLYQTFLDMINIWYALLRS